MCEEFLDDDRRLISVSSLDDIVEEGYILGDEGIFLQEITSLGKIRKRFEGKLYGFPKVFPKLIYTLPKVPIRLLNEIYSIFYDIFPNEVHLNVLWNSKKKEYRIDIPDQEVTSSESSYKWPDYEENDEVIVIAAHSHNSMPAFFSATDDKASESGFCQMVIGCIKAKPEVIFRYGRPQSDIPLVLEDIFDISSDYKIEYVIRNWDCISMVKEKKFVGYNYSYNGQYNNYGWTQKNWDEEDYYNAGWNQYSNLDKKTILPFNKLTKKKAFKKVNFGKRLVSFKMVKGAK